MSKQRLRIVPLGGLGEIGKNMMVLEYQNDIIVIDAGLMFPREEMLGIDLVVPDTTYLVERKSKIRAIIITHGHEDHVGALPYVLPELNVPIYATRLTHGLISVKLKEHKLLDKSTLNIIQPGDEVDLGAFRVEFFRVSHSIPDAVGLAIRTPIGTVVHTGDFKFDHTPVDGKLTDFGRLAHLGDQGVLALFSDSTYVERAGYTPSERVISDAFDRIMGEAPGRVIVATFASLISRIQQVMDSAAKSDRKVAIAGRSMINNVQIATEMGYLNPPAGVLVKVEQLHKLRPDQCVIVTTGSQGEPMSALARIANKAHKQIKIVPGDTVLISASPIPGNEALINRTIDNLFRQGANVLYSRIADVHVHGHASQEELKLMISLLRPKFFIPIHGEYRQLFQHTLLAQSLGIPEGNTFVLDNGHVLEMSLSSARVVDKVQAGDICVDGLGVGDISHIVLKDRQLLAQDGVLVVIVAADREEGKIVGRPDIVSRGFVFMRESEDLIEQAKDVVAASLNHGFDLSNDWTDFNSRIKESLSRFLYERTRRRPMILPVMVEV